MRVLCSPPLSFAALPLGTCLLQLSFAAIKTEDADVKQAFRLRKQPLESDVIFDVAETVHGAICDCPDFVLRRDGLDPRGCLHVRAMKAVGLI